MCVVEAERSLVETAFSSVMLSVLDTPTVLDMETLPTVLEWLEFLVLVEFFVRLKLLLPLLLWLPEEFPLLEAVAEAEEDPLFEVMLEVLLVLPLPLELVFPLELVLPLELVFPAAKAMGEVPATRATATASPINCFFMISS